MSMPPGEDSTDDSSPLKNKKIIEIVKKFSYVYISSKIVLDSIHV